MDKCRIFEDKQLKVDNFETHINSVNEAVAVYANTFTQFDVAKSFGLQDLLDDKLMLIKAIRMGIPFTLFNEIKNITPFSDDDWAEILSVSTKSLQRYKQEKDFLFKPIHSEKIIEIAEVSLLGNLVFGDSSKFKLWLNTPSYALGNMLPIELLKDSYGKEMVLAELHRIDHGIFA